MLETSHTQRLKADLETIRMLKEMHRGDDDKFDTELASIELTQITNLAKAERAEAEYESTYRVNAEFERFIIFLQQIAGVDLSAFDWRLPDHGSAEARNQCDSLTRLRELLKCAALADNPDVKELKRLASLLIKSEKLLYFEEVNSGVFLTAEQVEQAFQTLAHKLTAELQPRVSHARWGEIADQIVAYAEGRATQLTNEVHHERK